MTAADKESRAEEGIRWGRVNAEPFEYAIQQGDFGDEFVKLVNGSCLRRALPLTDPLSSGHGVRSVAGAIYRYFASLFPKPTIGALRIWWIPQIPGDAFEWPVADLAQAALMLDALAAYDDFQFAKRVKGDYSNAGGLQVFSGENWNDWEDEDCDGFDAWREKQKSLQTSPPASQGSEEVLGNATLAVPISAAQRISSDGMTCYARDEVLCDDQWCLRVGCLVENKRWAAAEAPKLALAAAIHKARWPADRTLAATPFEDEDRNGREYCLRIADAVADFLRSLSAEPVASDEANKLVFPNPPSNSGAGE